MKSCRRPVRPASNQTVGDVGMYYMCNRKARDPPHSWLERSRIISLWDSYCRPTFHQPINITRTYI